MSAADPRESEPRSRWDAFMSSLDPAWMPVALAFNDAFGVVRAARAPDGGWVLDLSCALADVDDLLRSAPAPFVPVANEQDWLLDQHLESEGGVLVASEVRAVVSWSDHFAAGLHATLRVCASAEAYEDAVAEACAGLRGHSADEATDDVWNEDT